MLTITECFKKWRHYLEELIHSIEMITDHNNLQQFLTKKSLNRWEVEWAQNLRQFNFYIWYRSEAQNPADRSLRRLDYYKESEKWENLFQIMLARLQKDCKKHAEDMQRAEEDNDEDENIIISMLIRS